MNDGERERDDRRDVARGDDETYKPVPRSKKRGMEEGERIRREGKLRWRDENKNRNK